MEVLVQSLLKLVNNNDNNKEVVVAVTNPFLLANARADFRSHTRNHPQLVLQPAMLGDHKLSQAMKMTTTTTTTTTIRVRHHQTTTTTELHLVVLSISKCQ